MELLTERYASKIEGMLSCYDRIVMTGTLPVLSNANQMTSYLVALYNLPPIFHQPPQF
jgi:hypothetical protein